MLLQLIPPGGKHPLWPYSTEAATRPNKGRHDAREFPF
jgi:hypothetical protein